MILDFKTDVIGVNRLQAARFFVEKNANLHTFWPEKLHFRRYLFKSPTGVKNVIEQKHVPAANVEFQFLRERKLARHGAGSIAGDPNEIQAQRQIEMPDEIGEEHNCAVQKCHNHQFASLEVPLNLGGELLNSGLDLIFREQDGIEFLLPKGGQRGLGPAWAGDLRAPARILGTDLAVLQTTRLLREGLFRCKHLLMQLRRNLFSGTVALICLAALSLNGCKKAADSGSASGSTGNGAGQPGETIPVGEYASLTGKEAAFGQSSHKGTQLAVEEINQAGGVLGKKLNLITEDTQSKQGESATGVRKLISRDKVVAVLGEVASSRSLEGASVCQPGKIPMISPSSTNPKVTQFGDYIFRVCFEDTFQGRVLAKFGKDSLKLKNVAIFSDATAAYSQGLGTSFMQNFTQSGGQIAVQQKYNGGDKDFRAQLTAIKGANPDGIFVPGYYTDVGLIVSQARQLGINLPIFGGDGWEAPQLIEIGGDALKNTYYSTHFYYESNDPKVQEFVKKFKAKFNEIPDAMAALGYDSALVLADAIKRANSTDPQKLRDAIAATKEFPGVTGKTTIDESRNASKPAVILTVQERKFKLLETVTP